jgi:Uma2 family endonuclease
VSTTTLVSINEYLHTVYRPDCEYIDGVLLERNVGEWNHSRLQTSISGFLWSREKKLGILVVVEQRVQVKPTRFRIPDIAVLTKLPTGGIITDPPFLCIEILSPDDRMSEMQERIDDYLAFGVPHVWVIDPRTRRAFEYTSEGMRDAKDGILSTSNPDIRVVLAEIESKAQ